jgi:hypothetical protein
VEANRSIALILTLSLSQIVTAQSAAPDCTKPEVVHQIREYVTCQTSLALGACGALGGYVGGRVAYGAYQKSLAQKAAVKNLQVPSLAALSDADTALLKEYEQMRSKINELENSKKWKKLLSKIPDQNVIGGTKEDILKMVGNPTNQEDAKIKAILEELKDFSAKHGDRINELLARGSASSSEIYQKLKAAGKNAWWDKEGKFLLLQPDQLKNLPKGTVVYSINGEQALAGFRPLNDDVRGGHTAWGVKAPSTDETLGAAAKSANVSTIDRVLMKFGIQAGSKAAGRAAGLLLGAVTGGALFAAGEIMDSTPTACQEIGDNKLNLDTACKPVYKVDGKVANFLAQDDAAILKDFKNPKICSYYTNLRNKLFEQPKITDISCNSANQIAMKLESGGVRYNGTISLSEGKVAKMNFTSPSNMQQVNMELLSSTEEFSKVASNKGGGYNLQTSEAPLPESLAGLMRQTKLYVPDLVEGCRSGSNNWKSAFLSGGAGNKGGSHSSSESTR